MSAISDARKTDYDDTHARPASSRPARRASRAALLSAAGWFAAALVHFHLRLRHAAPGYYSTWLYGNAAARNSGAEHDALKHAGRRLAAGNRFRLDKRDRRSAAGAD